MLNHYCSGGDPLADGLFDESTGKCNGLGLSTMGSMEREIVPLWHYCIFIENEMGYLESCNMMWEMESICLEREYIALA